MKSIQNYFEEPFIQARCEGKKQHYTGKFLNFFQEGLMKRTIIVRKVFIFHPVQLNL